VQVNEKNKTQILEPDYVNKVLSFRDYVFLFRLHSKKIIMLTILTSLISIYKVFTTPPSYTAKATIVIREKPESNLIMDMTGNRERNRIENEIQLIKSKAVAKAVIKNMWDIKRNSLDLFGSYPYYPRGREFRKSLKKLISFGLYDPKSDKPINYGKRPYDDQIGERFANKLINRLNINPRPRSDIIDISYTSVWPIESQLIINTVADTYKDFDKNLSGEKASNSLKFLEKLVQNIEQELNKSEKELTEFKKKEKMYDLNGPAIDISSQIAAIEIEIYNANSEKKLKQEKYSILKSKLSIEEKNLANKILNTIDAQVVYLRNDIGSLEGQLIQNIALYGEGHSAIKSIKSKIDILKIQLNNKVNELTKQGIVVQDPLQSRQEIITQLISLDNEIVALKLKKKQSEELKTIFEDKLNQLPPKQLKFSRLLRNNVVLNQNYSLLRQKLEEAKINIFSQFGKVQIVDYASVPEKSADNHTRTILLGIFLGIGISFGLIMLIEVIDNTVKTNHDIENNNLSVLGIIPSIDTEDSLNTFGIFRFFNKKISNNSNKGIKRRLMTREDPRSPISEAYRSLRTSMLYTGVESEVKSILVSSAGPGEGKTTTVANMAITYANLGRKTLLVDTDLRRPVVHKIFDLDKEPGITNFLSGNVTNFNELIKDTDIDNLKAVTSGIIPPNPSELLGSKKMGDLIKDLEKDWDIILFDSPPLVAVTDATMVSKEIDKIIIVVKVGYTDKKAFEHTVRSLRNVNAPIGGVVLNAVTQKSSYGSYYYYYQYYHYYGSDK